MSHLNGIEYNQQKKNGSHVKESNAVGIEFTSNALGTWKREI